MPQQFFTNDYVGNAAPIQRAISSAANNLSTGIQSGFKAYDESQKAQVQQKANADDYDSIKRFFTTAGATADWDKLAPRPDESNDQYRARLKTDTMPILDQLDRAGFDPREIAATAQIPGITLDTMTKLAQKRSVADVTKQLQGEIPDGAKKAIAAGSMPLDQINKTYGTNVTQDDYNKVAGISEPSASFQHASGTTDFVQATAADKPTTPVPQPISYSQGKRIVDNADIPSTDKATFKPQLETIANRELGANITPGQTPVSMYKGAMVNGLPETTLLDKATTAMSDADKLAFKKIQDARKERGANSSYLQSLMKDDQFKKRMAAQYGDKANKVSDNIYTLTTQRLKLDEQYQNAVDGKIDYDAKGIPLTTTEISNRQDAIDAEIARQKSAVSGFSDLVESFNTNPSRYTPPVILPRSPNPAPRQPIAPQKKGNAVRPPLGSFVK